MRFRHKNRSCYGEMALVRVTQKKGPTRGDGQGLGAMGKALTLEEQPEKPDRNEQENY